jgi:NADPH:quinone reductase-like Zn-dependent oxidoreductase
MKYKRLVINRKGGPEALQVVEADLPEPAPGEVHVKVLTAGVLLADVMWQEGKVPGGPKPPFTPGYDLVGVVDKLGQGVSDLAVGQTVAAMIQYGGYTQYAFLPPEQLVPVPDGLDPAEVVCLTVNYMTGYQLYKRVAKLTPGRRVLVHGSAGGTGSAMLDVGRVLGLEMYGTASKPKHDLVSSLGATPIDYRNEDFVERIRGLTGDGVDLVVDHIGGAHLKRSFQTLRAGGLLVSTASTAQVWGETSTLEIMLGIIQLPLWNMLPNKKSAMLFDLVQFNKKNPTWYAEDLKVLMSYLAEGKIKPVIAKRMPLVEAQQAQELILGAKVKGKIVLICT